MKRVLSICFVLTLVMWCSGTPTKSMGGARNISVGTGAETPTAKDYVQDGLVAMWDGIENAGWGLHDPNATVWKDLVGGNNLTMYNHGTHYEHFFSDDSLQGACYWSNDQMIKEMTSAVFSDGFTYEEVRTRTGFSGLVGSPNLGIGNWFQSGGYIGNQTFIRYRNTGPTYFPMSSDAPYSFVRSCAVDSNGAAMKLFIDGSFKQSIPAGSISTFSSSAVYIGFNLDTVDESSKFPILIHNVRIYSRALTAAEIAANYAIDKQRFNLP